jgi:phage terminase Nu1 subunit (DNA packaging protein)
MAEIKTCTANTLAQLFGLTARRIRGLAEEGIIPRPRRGEYDLARSIRQYCEYLRASATQGSEELGRERVRLLRSRADIAEIERKKLELELIPVADAEMLWSAIIVTVRTRMLALPHRVSAVVPPELQREVFALAEREVHEALTEFAKGELIWSMSIEKAEEVVYDD